MSLSLGRRYLKPAGAGGVPLPPSRRWGIFFCRPEPAPRAAPLPRETVSGFFLLAGFQAEAGGGSARCQNACDPKGDREASWAQAVVRGTRGRVHRMRRETMPSAGMPWAGAPRPDIRSFTSPAGCFVNPPPGRDTQKFMAETACGAPPLADRAGGRRARRVGPDGAGGGIAGFWLGKSRVYEQTGAVCSAMTPGARRGAPGRRPAR